MPQLSGNGYAQQNAAHTAYITHGNRYRKIPVSDLFPVTAHGARMKKIRSRLRHLIHDGIKSTVNIPAKSASRKYHDCQNSQIADIHHILIIIQHRT